MKRLAGELKLLLSEDYDIDLPDADDLFEWNVKLEGPMGTPYERGMFIVNIKFPSKYPFELPEAKIITKMFHPNVSAKGKICLGIEVWTPKHTVKANILERVKQLLLEPDLANPNNPEAAGLATVDPKKFDTKAREFTKTFAS